MPPQAGGFSAAHLAETGQRIMQKACYIIGWIALIFGVLCTLTLLLFPLGLYFLIFGLGLLILTAAESWRYKRHLENAGNFIPTDEKYFDEQTGQAMQVFYNPTTGQRDYRPVDQSQPPLGFH